MGDSRASISGMLAGGQRFTIEVADDVGMNVYLRDQIMVEARNMLTSLNGSGGTVTLRTSTEDDLRAENAKMRGALGNFVDWFDEATHPDSTGEVFADEVADEVLRLRALGPAADETGGAR